MPRPSVRPPLTAFAATHPGLEVVLAGELETLGIVPAAVFPGGAEFPARLPDLIRANLCLRTAGRVLVRVASFHASAFHELERHAGKVDWGRFVASGVPVHFRVTTKKSKLYHERAIVERLAAAIGAHIPGVAIVTARADAEVDEQEGSDRPRLQRFVVRIHQDECTISADSSGPLLHRRGYRLETARAPLRETLAAGLLLASGYDGSTPLVDPMCGSGTIPIEAALIARRIAPGIARRFAFENWPEVDAATVALIREELRRDERARSSAPILGSDRDMGAIRASAANAERAGVSEDIEWRVGAVSSMVLPSDPGLICVNPPYGVRVGNRLPLRNLYAQFGKVVRQRAGGWRVAMVSADRMLEAQTGLAWDRLADTENGGLKVRFVGARVPGL